MEKWSCRESCSECFGSSIKDKCPTYRSGRRNFEQARGVVLPGKARLGVIVERRAILQDTPSRGSERLPVTVLGASPWAFGGKGSYKPFLRKGKRASQNWGGRAQNCQGSPAQGSLPRSLGVWLTPALCCACFRSCSLHPQAQSQLHQSPSWQPRDSWPQCRVIYAFQRRDESGCWEQWGRTGRGRDRTSTAGVGFCQKEKGYARGYVKRDRRI